MKIKVFLKWKYLDGERRWRVGKCLKRCGQGRRAKKVFGLTTLFWPFKIDYYGSSRSLVIEKNAIYCLRCIFMFLTGHSLPFFPYTHGHVPLCCPYMGVYVGSPHTLWAHNPRPLKFDPFLYGVHQYLNFPNSYSAWRDLPYSPFDRTHRVSSYDLGSEKIRVWP